MRRTTDIILILALVAAGVLVWLGQQRPPDRYLEDIRTRGTLRVGIDPTYPPFESVRDGQVVGYDVDLARAIAADLGVTLDVKALALDTLYDALAAGNVDVLVSAAADSPSLRDPAWSSAPPSPPPPHAAAPRTTAVASSAESNRVGPGDRGPGDRDMGRSFAHEICWPDRRPSKPRASGCRPAPSARNGATSTAFRPRR